MFCPKCGKEVDNDVIICPACGKQINEVETTNTVINVAAPQPQQPAGKPKSKLTALLLCWFFGLLGVHRFYEGKIGTGILWLLTGGCFGIGAVVDFIILCCKPSTYYV